MNQSVFLRKSHGRRRVVVTGLGAVTPVGTSVASSWDNLIQGRSGIGKISAFDVTGHSTEIAGEVKGFDPSPFIEKKDLKKMDRFIHFALAATDEALKDAQLDLDAKETLRSRTGTIVGVGIGGLPTIESQANVLANRGPSRISPFFIPSVITNLSSGQISIKYGLKGPNFTVTSACASGAHAIGEAAKFIENGTCDVMLAGGCESTVTSLGIAGFSAMKALSTRNNQPELSSRPYDKDRDGFVLSEGGGMLILEDLEHAQRRGAKIYCELVGYGTTSDAFHMTAGTPEGQSVAMKIALRDAELNPEDISYINAHGTSTPIGDAIETNSIKLAFGAHAEKLWVSSTKSMTGHTLGAAGAIESVFSIMALEKQIAPPTINLENPSEDCDLDYVPITARDGKFQSVLNNSFGFGGTNACLIFSKMK